jgi:hypothetical protein
MFVFNRFNLSSRYFQITMKEQEEEEEEKNDTHTQTFPMRICNSCVRMFT